MTENHKNTPSEDPEATKASELDQEPGAQDQTERGSGGNDGGLDSFLLLEVLTAMRRGDFSQRLPIVETGVTGKIYDALNDIIELNQNQSKEFGRIAEVVGREGRLAQRTSAAGATGSWADTVTAVNLLIDDLARPSMEISRVVSAVAAGDLSQTMALEIEGRPLAGEFLQTANTVNRMVDQLSSFSSEVTRVAIEVGTEGTLGGQATVDGVSGTWRDLTESVNGLASNLTAQVR
ncbi:MAG: HAMP domain-containing protein, partial [Glaciecola sp.]